MTNVILAAAVVALRACCFGEYVFEPVMSAVGWTLARFGANPDGEDA